MVVGCSARRNRDSPVRFCLLAMAGNRICSFLTDFRMVARSWRNRPALCLVGCRPPQGWGWWLVGGVIDLFIGFMLVRSVILSELVFPYFIAIVFLFWGLGAIFSSVSQRARRYWWLYLINGILLMVIGFFFLEAGYIQNMLMTSMLTSLAFIYWGFCICMLSYDIRPASHISRG